MSKEGLTEQYRKKNNYEILIIQLQQVKHLEEEDTFRDRSTVHSQVWETPGSERRL